MFLSYSQFEINGEANLAQNYCQVESLTTPKFKPRDEDEPLYAQVIIRLSEKRQIVSVTTVSLIKIMGVMGGVSIII